MESGLYVTFFDSGEKQERELPPVGPLEHVVVRHRELLADRRAVTEAPDMGLDIARWLEAELELQRATGEEPGGAKRGEMRIVSRDGVFVRFAVFGDLGERDVLPELGPFAVVVVGRRGLEADGQLIATRTASELAAWELTGGAGDAIVGKHKPDVAFRTTSTAYHGQLAPLPRATSRPDQRPAVTLAPPLIPRATQIVAETPLVAPAFELPPAPAAPEPVPEPLFRPSAPRDLEVYEPPTFAPTAEEPSALTPGDLELIQRIEQQRAEDTLRARIQDEERRRLGVDDSTDEASTWAMRYRTQEGPAATEVAGAESGGGRLDLGALIWRLRFAIIGVLLLGVGAYGFTVVQSGGASSVPGQQTIKYVGIAQKISSDRWDYVVNGVQRSPTAGSATARGVYYVVRIGVTNKGTDGAQISPSQFVLTDANGTEYRAVPVSGGPYYGADNPQSQFVWPQSFGVGKTATVGVVFDIDPGLGRGMQLAIADLPNTRVKLD